MKVLIVNTYDIEGGAARAAYRLHKSLLGQEIDSKLLVQCKNSDNQTVISDLGKGRQFLNRIRAVIDTLPTRRYTKRERTIFSPCWLGFNNISNKINELQPDIVHLHWICDGFIRIEEIAEIKAPIVWTLHDCWAFTGGCHYPKNCQNYLQHCGCCPKLGSNRGRDLSKKIWQRKKKTFSQLDNITIVGLSRWLQELAQKSSLLEDKNVVNLPNPIDTNLFKPLDKRAARDLWQLPRSKKFILFGASSSLNDPIKGFDKLCAALQSVNDPEVELVVFGCCKPANPPEMRHKIRYVGRLNDDISLVALYNAVDVMVVPSREENLSNTIMESLACGTPVVGFDIGGNSDMVDHQYNGYLAKPYDDQALALGINWTLDNANYVDLCGNARKKVASQFANDIVASKYIQLYESLR